MLETLDELLLEIFKEERRLQQTDQENTGSLLNIQTRIAELFEMVERRKQELRDQASCE